MSTILFCTATHPLPIVFLTISLLPSTSICLVLAPFVSFVLPLLILSHLISSLLFLFGSTSARVFTCAAQIALVTSQITWTEEVERALEELESGQEDAVKKYQEV